MRSGCGRSTILPHDLNIEEQPGLQDPCYLPSGQHTHSNKTITSVGANHQCRSPGSLRMPKSYRYMYSGHSTVHSLGSRGRWTDIAN